MTRRPAAVAPASGASRTTSWSSRGSTAASSAPSRAPVDLARWLRAVTADYAGLSLEGPAALRIETDSRRLARILFVLLDNAALHGSAPVTLRYDEQALTVTDCGPGLPGERPRPRGPAVRHRSWHRWPRCRPRPRDRAAARPRCWARSSRSATASAAARTSRCASQARSQPPNSAPARAKVTHAAPTFSERIRVQCRPNSKQTPRSALTSSSSVTSCARCSRGCSSRSRSPPVSRSGFTSPTPRSTTSRRTTPCSSSH